MCFSATASFGAAAILGTIGVVSLKKVREPSQIMFAAIPLVFAIQQACEGVVWLSFMQAGFQPWRITAMYSFLFFAQILWPLWIPVSFYLLETGKTSRKWQMAIIVAGGIVSLITTYRLFMFQTSVEILSHHIVYNIEAPHIYVIICNVLYFIATIIPGLVSANRSMKILSLLLFGSLVFSKIFYELYFISVWCFFGALLSVVIVYMMKQFQRESSVEMRITEMEN